MRNCKMKLSETSCWGFYMVGRLVLQQLHSAFPLLRFCFWFAFEKLIGVSRDFNQRIFLYCICCVSLWVPDLFAASTFISELLLDSLFGCSKKLNLYHMNSPGCQTCLWLILGILLLKTSMSLFPVASFDTRCTVVLHDLHAGESNYKTYLRHILSLCAKTDMRKLSKKSNLLRCGHYTVCALLFDVLWICD